MTCERMTIVCDSCERLWTLACVLTVYERQALESRPCPHCGAYTLTCQGHDDYVAADCQSAR
jgi:hypothetical protein